MKLSEQIYTQAHRKPEDLTLDDIADRICILERALESAVAELESHNLNPGPRTPQTMIDAMKRFLS
jgi:hypothetical protein